MPVYVSIGVQSGLGMASKNNSEFHTVLRSIQDEMK